MPLGQGEYYVAFSYASQDKDYVNEVYEILQEDVSWHGIYNYSEIEGEEAELIRRFQSIYGDKSKVVVVFFSSFYREKSWTELEWGIIQNRITSGKPVVLVGVGKDPYIPKIAGNYERFENETPAVIAEKILGALTRATGERECVRSPIPWPLRRHAPRAQDLYLGTGTQNGSSIKELSHALGVLLGRGQQLGRLHNIRYALHMVLNDCTHLVEELRRTIGEGAGEDAFRQLVMDCRVVLLAMQPLDRAVLAQLQAQANENAATPEDANKQLAKLRYEKLSLNLIRCLNFHSHNTQTEFALGWETVIQSIYRLASNDFDATPLEDNEKRELASSLATELVHLNSDVNRILERALPGEYILRNQVSLEEALSHYNNQRFLALNRRSPFHE